MHLSILNRDGTETLDLPPMVSRDTTPTIDLFGTHGFYRSDMARQIACEPPPDKTRSRMDAVAAMQDAMIGAVRPGLSLHDAYTAATRAATPWSGMTPPLPSSYTASVWRRTSLPASAHQMSLIFPYPMKTPLTTCRSIQGRWSVWSWDSAAYGLKTSSC